VEGISRALNREPPDQHGLSNRLSQLSHLSLPISHLDLYISLVKAAEQTSPSNSPNIHITQWRSAQKPRPSSGAHATTTTTATTTSPRPTPQTLTSDGPAMSTSPASPCPGPNTVNHRRRNTKSTSKCSASPTPGDARVSRASTLPWAHEHPADCPARRRVGAAAGTAGRRV